MSTDHSRGAWLACPSGWDGTWARPPQPLGPTQPPIRMRTLVPGPARAALWSPPPSPLSSSWTPVPGPQCGCAPGPWGTEGTGLARRPVLLHPHSHWDSPQPFAVPRALPGSAQESPGQWAPLAWQGQEALATWWWGEWEEVAEGPAPCHQVPRIRGCSPAAASPLCEVPGDYRGPGLPQGPGRDGAECRPFTQVQLG